MIEFYVVIALWVVTLLVMFRRINIQNQINDSYEHRLFLTNERLNSMTNNANGFRFELDKVKSDLRFLEDARIADIKFAQESNLLSERKVDYSPRKPRTSKKTARKGK
jgi:hypothetical protein